MKSILITALICVFAGVSNAQVKTNFSNAEKIGLSGKYSKNFRGKNPYVIPARNIKALLRLDSLENLSGEAKPFKIAEAIPVDIDVLKEAEWVEENSMAYGKFTIVAANAKSVSANFNQFFLPEGTELYVYNENGEMITGPITEGENNENNFWGTWVYKGNKLTVDFKLPVERKNSLKLHISSLAYGFKDIYRTEIANFGESEACNINVLCAIGTGWENERNSVSLILDASSEALCSGALVNNTCNLNIPYLLTANHCFDTPTPQNVAQWKFTFQAWSSTCTPSLNANGVTFNGSALRARNAATDFCLVELNQLPPTNSGITFSGWSRNTAGITSTTIIHHPVGDIMKISRDNQAPVFDNFSGAQCWRLGLDIGATQGGSSGAPYYDQNHRIIAQHFGINDAHLPVCDRVNKFGGRFDLSWTGGGTNATRLSNWLDPGNTGAMTTNSRNIFVPEIIGNSIICTSQTYQIDNLPPGATVNWSSTWNSAPYPTLMQNSPLPNQCTINNTYQYPSSTTLTATITTTCGTIVLTKEIMSDYANPIQYGTYSQQACYFHNTYNPASSGSLPTALNTPVFLRQGCMATISLQSMVGKTVSFSGSTQPLYWHYNSSQSKLYLQLPYMSAGTPFTFTISGEGACQNKSLLFFSYAQPYYPSYSFYLSPNPVSDNQLTLSMKQDITHHETKTITNTDLIFQISIIDLSSGEIVVTGLTFDGKSEKSIDISKLAKGLYVLKVHSFDQVQDLRFVRE
ncbi:MAG: T9SS type A sorting domain-containing protein [Chryseotalea sp.]|jgi:lysyl endopeptidase|nr:T9SS type A sorting domain-containing protein [Flammeovirgaceae bacterium]